MNKIVSTDNAFTQASETFDVATSAVNVLAICKGVSCSLLLLALTPSRTL